MYIREAKIRMVALSSQIVADGLKSAMAGESLENIAANTTRTLLEFIEELIECLPEGKA